MADDDTYEIQKEPVHARDESPAKLLGWTIEEIGLLLGVFFGGMLFGIPRTVLIGVMVVIFVYLRKIKQRLPERFMRNYMRHVLRKQRTYRAGGRDTHWRPPIVRNR
jgi:hypothetical protein